jgi:transcriptional regulator with XRE-family HTH domain
MANMGELIRERRTHLKLKVYELAQQAGISPVYITQIERYNKLPSFIVYKNIEKALDLPLDLRIQYYREKYPEISETNFPNAFEMIVKSDVAKNSTPARMLENFIDDTGPNPQDARAFIISLANKGNPTPPLSEKQIQKLTAMVKKAIKLRWASFKLQVEILSTVCSIKDSDCKDLTPEKMSELLKKLQ